jgi:hypothetical protein
MIKSAQSLQRKQKITALQKRRISYYLLIELTFYLFARQLINKAISRVNKLTVELIFPGMFCVVFSNE